LESMRRRRETRVLVRPDQQGDSRRSSVRPWGIPDWFLIIGFKPPTDAAEY